MDKNKDIKCPLLPLRDVVIFPTVVTPLFVGRDKSIRALQAAMDSDKQIMLVAQKNPQDDEPDAKSIYTVGTLSSILQLIKLPDGTVKVLVEGKQRAKIIDLKVSSDFNTSKVQLIDTAKELLDSQSLIVNLKSKF